MAADRCCPCNGPRATCSCCVCANKKRSPCFSCRPGENGNCKNPHISNMRNVRSTCARSPAAIIPTSTLSGHSRHSNHSFSSSDSDSDPHSSSSSGPVQPSSSFRPSFSGSGSELGADGHYLDDKEVDDMIVNAFSGSLCHSDDDLSDDDVWYTRWRAISQLSSRHYDIPKGPCGRRYVDFLCDEVNLLSRNNSSSERLLVFSSVVLQSDQEDS